MKPVYLITYWDGIPLEFFSEERMKEAIDCGFNLIQGGKVGGYLENAKKDEAYDVKTSQKALEICEKYGVQYTVFDIRIANLFKENPTEDEIDATVRAVCEDFRSYPALHSYLIIDEPHTSQFEQIKKITDAFKRYDPEHLPYINLFPNYASAKQLGTADYESYVEQFVETVKPELLCYDHYHFLKINPKNIKITVPPDSFEAQVYAASLSRDAKSGFYNNLEIIRKNGLKNDIPYMVIVLLVEHGPCRNVTRAELFFEVWQSLAYGCSALSYYSYWELPPHNDYDNGIISFDGKKRDHYYDAQEINRRISPVGEHIALTKSEAVFHIGNSFLHEGATPFTPHRGIESISGGNLTVGFFENGTFIIANQDYVSSATITITTEKDLSLFNIETNSFDTVTENTFNIPAGEGIYLKISD